MELPPAVADRAVELHARARTAGTVVLGVLRPIGRRGPEIVAGIGVLLTVLGLLVLVAAARNDAKIDANSGRSVAEVLEGSSRPHTFVRFTAADGAVLTPEKGVFYPAGLEAGQLVRVEYDRTDPELVRVEGRTWTVGIVPIALGVLGVWVLCGPGAWALARRRRRADGAVPPGRADEREDGEPELAGAGAP